MRHPQGAAALVFALTLLATLLSGCTNAPPAFVAGWEKEAVAHGPMGVPATMDLAAERYAVVGEGTLSGLQAPFDIVPAARTPRAGTHVFFHATVLDVGTGILVLDGGRITVAGGTLDEVPVSNVERLGDGLAAWLDAESGSKPDVRFPESTDDPESESGTDLQSAWFFADSASIRATDLVVEEADQARILMDGNVTSLTLPIRFDADVIAFDPDSALRFDAATATFSSFGYAGETVEGTVAPVGRAPIDMPDTIFGDDATLRFTPDGLASNGTFRLTQATTPDGYALPASVQLQPDDASVDVHRDNVTWVQVRYREKGYLGAAILENVTVTGAAADLVTVPLAAPPWIVETLWQEVADAGIAAPFLAIPLAAASPFLVLAEALFKGLDCLFSDCPSEHPYPAWMPPGEVGRFYYQVDATGVSPGTYEGSIRFTGANHDPVEVPVHIRVLA